MSNQIDSKESPPKDEIIAGLKIIIDDVNFELDGRLEQLMELKDDFNKLLDRCTEKQIALDKANETIEELRCKLGEIEVQTLLPEIENELQSALTHEKEMRSKEKDEYEKRIAELETRIRQLESTVF